jgi:hypothetical protein
MKIVLLGFTKKKKKGKKRFFCTYESKSQNKICQSQKVGRGEGPKLRYDMTNFV